MRRFIRCPSLRPLTKKRLIIVLLVLCSLPALVLVPLAPFTFLIIEGEGRIPGRTHEYLSMALLLTYPLVLIASGVLCVRQRRLEAFGLAAVYALLPMLWALLLVWVYLAGGVQLK